MAKIITENNIKDRIIDYLDITLDKDLNPTTKLKSDAPYEIKKYYPIWLAEQTKIHKDLQPK